MRRREFIALLGGIAVARPLVAHAQHDLMRRIGILMALAADDSAGQARFVAFVQTLQGDQRMSALPSTAEVAAFIRSPRR